MADPADLSTPLARAVKVRDGSASTPHNFLSPSAHTHLGSVTADMVTTVVNDDEAERRERRKSKVLELTRRHLDSPATPTDRSRNQTQPILGDLSNNQVSEHYANCIKLSAENKINAKNAFGLHLIDYMQQLLHDHETTNFQVASSTLDASAKIYAGRVDAIHSETYKVLSGLGRGSDKPEKGDGAAEEGSSEQANTTKKRRERCKNVIETNLDNINVKKFDLEFEVDPLFHQMSAVFDEGGTGGLLLNHLCCLDDSSELILDSRTVIGAAANPPTPTHIDITEIRDLYRGVNLEPLEICPAFSNFTFMGWQRDKEDNLELKELAARKSSYAFDLDAETEPIPEARDGGDDEMEGFAPLSDDFTEDDHADGITSDHGNASDQSLHLGDNKEAQVVKSAMQNIKHGDVGQLMQVLASEPSDYSYFNTNLLRTWAGPEHWKVQPRSRDNKTGEPVKKREREAFAHDFDGEDTFEKHAKETRAATTRSKVTLDKNSKSSNILPEDLHYNASRLFNLFNKKKTMIKCQKMDTADVEIEKYDYDNINDKDNFCPAGTQDDDYDDDGVGGFDMDLTAGPNPHSQTQDLSSQFFLAGGDNMDATMLTGDNLLQQPRKVAKIDIAYAKTAKKMDVKRLKSAMWSVLSKPEKKKDATNNETEAETSADKDAPSEPVAGPSSGDAVAGPHSFQSLINTLPPLISPNMTNNLSVPIAFVCLLHLANEKQLALENTAEKDDLIITQG